MIILVFDVVVEMELKLVFDINHNINFPATTPYMTPNRLKLAWRRYGIVLNLFTSGLPNESYDDLSDEFEMYILVIIWKWGEIC